MRLNFTQKLMLAVSVFLLFICQTVFLFKEVIPPDQISATINYDLDTNALFQKEVILHRLPKFIQYLCQNGIPIQNKFELLLLLSNPRARQRISQQLQMDSNLLLLHAELADLMQIEMTEVDAQILHFSQRNYQNPFSGKTINLPLLVVAKAENILEDIGGWMAGNTWQKHGGNNGKPFLQNYSLSVEDIQSWICQANVHKFKIFAEVP